MPPPTRSHGRNQCAPGERVYYPRRIPTGQARDLSRLLENYECCRFVRTSLPARTSATSVEPREEGASPPGAVTDEQHRRRALSDNTQRAEVLLLLFVVAPQLQTPAGMRLRRSSNRSKTPLRGSVQSFSTAC